MTTTLLEKAQAFRKLHDSGIFVLPNPWSIGTARILESIGFKALATTSAGLAFSLGLRDGTAAVDAAQSIKHAAEIAEATSLPVSADLENGFGIAPDVVFRTIQRAGEAGLVGASIEDATFDAGSPLYDFNLAVERIKAAVSAARSLPFPFTLTARTEGFIRGKPDMDETLKRLVAFESAGADVLFAPGLPDLNAIRTVCNAVKKPVNVLAGHAFSLAELRDAGVRRVSTGSSFARAALTTLVSAAREVAEEGTFSFAGKLDPVAEWNHYFHSGNER